MFADGGLSGIVPCRIDAGQAFRQKRLQLFLFQIQTRLNKFFSRVCKAFLVLFQCTQSGPAVLTNMLMPGSGTRKEPLIWLMSSLLTGCTTWRPLVFIPSSLTSIDLYTPRMHLVFLCTDFFFCSSLLHSKGKP